MRTLFEGTSKKSIFARTVGKGSASAGLCIAIEGEEPSCYVGSTTINPKKATDISQQLLTVCADGVKIGLSSTKFARTPKETLDRARGSSIWRRRRAITGSMITMVTVGLSSASTMRHSLTRSPTRTALVSLAMGHVKHQVTMQLVGNGCSMTGSEIGYS